MELVKSDELMKESVLLKRVEWWKKLMMGDLIPNSSVNTEVYDEGLAVFFPNRHYRLAYFAKHVLFQLASSENFLSVVTWRLKGPHKLCLSLVQRSPITLYHSRYHGQVCSSYGNLVHLKHASLPSTLCLESRLSHIICLVQVQIPVIRFRRLYNQPCQSHSKP